MWARSSLYIICCVSLLLGSLSCVDSLDFYWRIDKFRVMAIKSDPVTLKPGRSAQFEVLAYNPSGEPITYAWEWCPFRTTPQNEYACPFTRDELAAQLAANLPDDAPDIDIAALIPDFNLGAEPKAALRYPATQELVLGLCQALQGFLAQQDEQLAEQISVTNCERGYEISVRLIATSGDERIIASKRVNLWTGSEFDQNSNPSITGIEIRLMNPSDAPRVQDRMPWLKTGVPHEQQWYTLPEDAVTPVVANVRMEVRALLPPESSELWQPPAPRGSMEARLPPEREVLLFRWMTTGGYLGMSDPIWKDGLNEFDEASISEFSFTYEVDKPEDELSRPKRKTDWDLDGVANGQDNCPYVANSDQRIDACNVRLWSIVRDGRLGIDWVERRVQVVGHVF